MDKTTVMVCFKIFGEVFPINEVMHSLNIEPTRFYNIGDIIIRPKNLR